ncbi:MAG: uroporphyrinogen-III synthase [Pseudomonadota bacterium]
MKILIIRPQPGNDASAARAQKAGHTPIQLPFFEVRMRDWDAPDPAQFDALLITSANAVRHAGNQLDAFAALPVHAVGRNSADAVRAAGFNLASTGNTGAEQAIENAREAGHRRLLWLAGEDQTAFAVPADMHIETRVVYAADPIELGEDAQQMVLQADVVALHSARAAEHFAHFVDAAGLDRSSIALAAFSQGIADAAGHGWRAIAVAERPEDQALLSAAHTLVRIAP